MPPFVVNATEPVWPKHNGWVGVKLSIKVDGAELIITVWEVEHPFASVAVKVYAPAANPVTGEVTVALPFCTTIAPVPPEVVNETSPVELEQSADVAVKFNTTWLGAAFIIIIESFIQLLVSFMPIV